MDERLKKGTMMTIDDFVTALHDCASAYTWMIDATRYLRGYGAVPAGEAHEYCPLTAVACARYGGLWDVTEWEQAASTYDLTMEDASAIVGAADDDGSDDGPLRARLLAAVGLAHV